MNLTLRNLLGWLDDTLEPEQSGEFGRMVASAGVFPLVARILKLNHEPLRLDEPRAEDLDPNRICDYFEGELTPDETVEFERQCFSSDAVMAEVVRVHRAISLRGPKREFRPETRARFYDLDPFG